jgi:hypothetical protein
MQYLYDIKHSVTYREFWWLIIMGSEFDDWHFFTISLNYDRPQSMSVYDSLHSLLDHECLLRRMANDERKTTNDESLLTYWTPLRVWVLRYDWRSVGQSVLEWSTHLGLAIRIVAGLLMWGALSDGRTGLSFTIAAGPCQHSHSRVQVRWDSLSYFTVSDSSVASYD